MERAAFQRHLPSEQNAEEEYRKQKKIASSVLLALGRRWIASKICWYSEVIDQSEEEDSSRMKSFPHPFFNETKQGKALDHETHAHTHTGS